MRFDKPNIVALLVSLSVGVLFVLLIFLVGLYRPINIDWQTNALIFVLLVLSSFVIIRFCIEVFIYNKVKIIYKNIHELKVGNVLDEEEVARTANLDMVNREVSEWAEQRRMEIAELREREDFRREFIGNISHELKTPIFNIQGYMLTLIDGGLDDPEINKRYLKRANKSVDRMISIVDDLETISALEANRVQLNIQTFDMVELVQETFEMLEDNAMERNITLRLKKVYDSKMKVTADREKISQVLTNLIVNAIKYGKQDGYVEVRFYDMHNQILTEVADDGLGIPQQDVPRIFERFYRVDKSRSREAGGTGLGLSIVKHILESHKQSINARSSEKAGTTFSFTLKKGK